MDIEIFFTANGEEFSYSGASAVVGILRDISAEIMVGSEQGVVRNSDGEIIGNWRIPSFS